MAKRFSSSSSICICNITSARYFFYTQLTAHHTHTKHINVQCTASSPRIGLMQFSTLEAGWMCGWLMAHGLWLIAHSKDWFWLSPHGTLGTLSRTPDTHTHTLLAVA